MKNVAIVLAVLVLVCGAVASGTQKGGAMEVIERYLKMPQPEEDRAGEARAERLEVLGELKQFGRGACR